MTTISADSIVVTGRQRVSAVLDEQFIQSVKKRLIHPIVVRSEPDDNHLEQIVLVVGERRLLALKAAGITDLEEGTHFRFFNDLSPTEARVIELEENVKRADLPWRDHVSAIANLHKIYSDENDSWSPAKTAEAINLDPTDRYVNRILLIHKNLASPLLRDCGGIRQAISILENAAERRIASIISDISQAGNQIFQSEPQAENSSDDLAPNSDDNIGNGSDNRGGGLPPNSIPVSRGKREEPKAVLSVDFAEWIKTYSGPKFTLIHCDFPYDIEYKQYAKSKTSTDEDYEGTGTNYWNLLEVLCLNLDKIASYQSHLMFWFSMKFYEKTKTRLASASLFVHDHPLIWLKTDNAGIIPGTDGTWPRRVYETALLCSRGKRPLVKPLANAYGAPTASNPVHPSQKPEPVLRHFFGMLVDETTDVLDPTCGSGSALRAAEDVGARSILGLELDLKYAETAESLTQQARSLRRLRR